MSFKQIIISSTYLHILFYLFVTTGLSQAPVDFHPVDYRVKEYRFNKSSISSKSRSIDNFTLNKDRKLIIEIIDKEGYKVSFNKKALKSHLKTQKNKFKSSIRGSKITITAKEDNCKIYLWEIFPDNNPHLFIKKASVGENIEIVISELKDKPTSEIKPKWIIPIADYSIDFIHKPILNDNTKDFIFCTLKGFDKSDGYVDVGDTIKINMGTDKFIDVSSQYYKKIDQIGNEVIIPIEKNRNFINIPLVGSFADTSEGEFMTQLELVTSSWTYKFDKKNNNISVGSLSYDIILPAAAVSNRLVETGVIIRIINGEQKIFRAGDQFLISINKENLNRISFISPSLCDIDKGKIMEKSDGEISFELIDDLLPGDEIYISALKISVNQLSGTISDISDAIQLKMPSIQGTPTMILKNAIVDADAKVEQYQYNEHIEIKVDRESQIKISSSEDEGKQINIIHNSDKYAYGQKNIFPLFSKSVTTLPIKLTNCNVGDSFEFVAVEKDNGVVEKITMYEIGLIDVDITWDLPNQRLLNILDGPHQIHFNIIDSANSLNSNDKIIINLPNNTDVQFKNIFNDSQTIINSKTLEVILDRGQSQKGEYFILDNASTTNKSIDLTFTIQSKNWEKTIKRSMNIGHPIIIIDEARSIILNRSLNPLPPIQIIGNNFLNKDDEIHFILKDNNDNIININSSTDYDRLDESQNNFIIYYESDTVYNISTEEIDDYSITSANIEIKLLSEINAVFSRQDSILYAVTPKLLFNNPKEYPYWVGNDEDSPDEVQILLDLRDNSANLYNRKSEVSINIPKQAGCKWENIGNDIQLKNDDQTIILELDTDRYPDLNNLGSMVELGIFPIVPSTAKPTEPFMFKYQLSGIDYVSDNKLSQYYYPEIDIKSIQGLINNDEEVEDIYVPIGTNYEINITNFIISDNTLNPLFEIGDTCIIRCDTDGFYWSDKGIYPSGIKLLSENEENENYVFVITEAINSINIKDIIIKYEGNEQPVNSVSNIICDLKKSTGVYHQFYLKQTIRHTELVVDINPNEIIWTRDDHRLPELTLQGPAINKDNEIIITLNSNSEADANISWDKASKKSGNGISESRISGNRLFLSLANLGSEKKVIVPEWDINNILSPESDISLNISVDGGKNYQDPVIGILNASLSEIYISRLRKILAVRSPQYIGMIKIKGNDDFPSILESDRLIITLTSDISPITGLQDEELQTCVNDISIIKKAESKQLSEKQIQYSFQFAQSINESEMLEIDNLKIYPEWEGVSTSITLNYAIGNFRNWSEINLSIPFKDTLYVFGTQLLASDKKMIYDLSKGEEYYKLPILTILGDSDNPLIQSGDRLFITIEDPNRRIHFKEPGFEFTTNRLFNIEHEPDKITFIFKSKLSDSLNIPLEILRPIDNEPMTFSSIQGEFSLRSGEKIKFDWPVEIAFSNGAPSYKLSNNKDFIINAGRQLMPDILLKEDSLQANTDRGDFIALVIPHDFDAKWDKTITKIASTDILYNNVSYSSDGDTARISIKKNAKLNEDFKIVGLGLDHIVGEISDGYSPIEIILDNNFHKPALKIMDNSGQIRTGMVDIILGAEEYITSDDHIINNLEIEFQQITHPELYFDELWLELVKRDNLKQPVGKWKEGNKYAHEWYENNYNIKKIKKQQKRLVLELKNKGEPLNDIIRLEGIQLKEPPKDSDTFSYGINILYKSNPDSVLAKSNEILSVQYEKVGGCFCTELETVVLGVDGLKPIDGEYDLMIDEIKIAGESYDDPDKILSIEYDENKLWIAKKKGRFDPKVPITVTMGYAINSQSKILCSYVQTECDNCEGGKHYAQNCVENPSSNPSRKKRKNTDKKSQNFSSVDIDRKSLKEEDGYVYFSTIFKPRAPQCIDNEKRFQRTKLQLEAVFEDSLNRDKHMTLDYWNNEINHITAKNTNCQEPPYRSNSKDIYYLLALNHYTSRDMKNACDYYKKATCELECIGDFMELPDCMDKGPDRIAADLVKNMSQNTHKINSYIEDLDNEYSYSEKFLEDLKDAQYTLLELESIDGWKSALKKNEKFHMLNVDLAILLIDIKYLENMYIYKKGHKKYGQLKKTVPKGIRKGKKYKEWRNSRITKYTALIENQRDTTNQLQMYSSKKREKLHTEVINIKFEKNKDIPFEILPKIYNMAEYSNLDEKHVSDFENVVEFNKRGIYKIDLDIEKDKKSAFKLASAVTSLLLILLII